MNRSVLPAAPALALLFTACATSQAAFDARAAFADADSIATRHVGPGVTYTFIHDGRGPWALHVLAIDPQVCGPVIDAVKPEPPLSRRATTSALGDDAVAAVNADFFMLPGGTTVGAHVRDGVPIIGPGDRPVFGVSGSHRWVTGSAMLDAIVRASADSTALTQINRFADEGLSLLTSWAGDTVTTDTTSHFLVLRVLSGDEAVGNAVIVHAGSGAELIRLNDRSAVLHAAGATRTWTRSRSIGDTVSWRARVVVDGVAVEEVVGGFPTLLRNDSSVLATQTVNAAFGGTRHPRTAVGWREDGTLLLVVADGRQAPWSDGMTLPELTWLFQRLGASDALNLDGGGSSAMVIDGEVVNRPSDREGERAVGNALALTRCTRWPPRGD